MTGAGTANNDETFRLCLTADFFDAAGNSRYRDIGLDRLAHEPRVQWRPFAAHQPEIQPEQLAGVRGVMVLTPRVTARSLEGADKLLIVSRFGVGYDSVDVAACTARDVLLCIAAGAVDRPVAEATVAWMLALTHRVLVKDRLVRESRWDDRSLHMGSDLRDKTVGIVGFGGIGRTVVKLLAGFGMQTPLVFDPHLSREFVAEQGACPVTLDELLQRSDFVSLHCPLTANTRGLIGAKELSRLKPTAFLINTARGGIVDEAALAKALSVGQLAGAAIDCFDTEPLRVPPDFAAQGNVLLAPHAIAWTDELFRDIGRLAVGAVIDVAHGRTPGGIVNPEVLARPSFQAKWRSVVPF